MHKDRPHLRRIHCRIEPLRRNLLHLMIPAIQRLPVAPSATPSQPAVIIHRDKVSPIRNQPAIHGEHRSQRPFPLSRRIILCLQPSHRSPNQLTNRTHILIRRNPQSKARHPPSIKARLPAISGAAQTEPQIVARRHLHRPRQKTACHRAFDKGRFTSRNISCDAAAQPSDAIRGPSASHSQHTVEFPHRNNASGKGR